MSTRLLLKINTLSYFAMYNCHETIKSRGNPIHLSLCRIIWDTAPFPSITTIDTGRRCKVISIHYHSSI
ncbi:hypothetical protein DESC_710091 [Desulfosarcina cetonica]|nr:hypothetical protein DESC_710091 [Desulfosarcina cetonica]